MFSDVSEILAPDPENDVAGVEIPLKSMDATDPN